MIFKTKYKKAGGKRSKILKLDDIFSKYIRLKDSVEGYTQCYTCGQWKFTSGKGLPKDEIVYKTIHAGHFIKRRKNGLLGTRWEVKNVKPQCYQCNKWLSGNESEFLSRLQREYGFDILDILKFKHNSSMSEFTIDELIIEYSEKLKELYKTKGNPWK